MAKAKERESHRSRLRAAGLRHTLPRERILAYLDRKNTHPTPEELHQGLRKKGHNIGLSTVYLNLQVLRNAGLLWEFKDQQGHTRYDGYTERHHHLLCVQCGAVQDILARELPEFNPEPIKTAIENRTGWFVEEARLELRGVCPSCQ
ncbi:Peroxide-responsive repressor PerR [Meiothermus luteus]|jgi:Fe2+ or Zn2+ uptake regulation protein|uniref:Peroxide-responsive repressor PerR n=1 Tax=Meiothermus luteus TaxID=2026184 RepID=A0A399EC65_9DEIN|nr:Fur family transcriptional regulator [Meiothermus luteus]RIH81935.1 Peroxide-responsive repressor PerR [Meiothermus luteus]RMH58312.1 MAG: transcriptional repressor [Deinococcota bacterium]